MKFSELAIPEPVMLGIRACGFTECTPIQALTLPLTLAGRDVAGQAQTGTGKTAAFLIAALSRIVDQDSSTVLPSTTPGTPRILIIAPTRELVVQIEQDARTLAAHTGLHILAVYGGVDYEKQRLALSEGVVDLLIGTPGRLIDYLKQKTYHCDQVQALVIDEADRMFDMGFIADLRYLLRRLPPHSQRLSMLFSATLSYRAQELSYEYMDSPEVVSTPMDVKTVQQVTQCLYHIEGRKKISLLVGLLHRDLAESDGAVPGRIMIFTNTKRMGETLQNWLEANGVVSGYLSGDVPQAKRLRVLQRFQSGELPVLIATDVAGRGLHIDGVTHVINFDLPENAEDYLHRIGRTARAGAKGDAISLVDEEGAYRLEQIEAYCGKIYVAWAPDELFVELHRPLSSSQPRSMAAGSTKRAMIQRKGKNSFVAPKTVAPSIAAGDTGQTEDTVISASEESEAAATTGKKRVRRRRNRTRNATDALTQDVAPASESAAALPS
ncbi:DEAD/DEAH box helicase [Candidatus Magnetaquicoccus inordinatus]|uniref:DEAD/DEAH box helicase n=1 Tax=Candidatus Magnetaquicoccus inordinatus TaxID=2496818 RepID=UPI00102B56A5|nr:DEAD/DEAH box helicase [Candidatus Magnetaquicoccus inordinatus]